MHNHTYFQERIDRLAMLYMEHHYDIKSMPIEEFVKTFDNICNEITDFLNSSK
ncbi:hypothetical protein BJV85_002546 [Clostridium acetobutylicum]|uniref:Uncharacterized protein n=1 Tax=Clostridium acetobutylicum (strain ATCC 824 / DSM 792 / JCM 1419 / IAM 19013 / LMG 5710 / NBRC 13948 / NRRL B-527 / VKM B-1787 / 2291 / W) TaxID=272562 RepID=Q97J37_CLOAB|nr:hypothetical protein [Clostridium acetobutylicum]AAK79417.1 Hypothetical protein CA_C1449 [Clostridium acetobutylicum ATCC 824]ADZ20502.1 Conserved hypothetical protein [Clostridium acetobutylicum EA 2018]AEI31813.1 hypothetical protein SMB_G1474 [Clostridium acetobutylicum DSM 1731]PSM04619.1 hypothetical protein C7T89_14785 [Clostridium sp. NJ4]AWV81335.1 hypothetical protein DK921_14790 [Clostridium acetobutylicum]